MPYVVILLVTVVPLLIAAAFMLGWYLNRRQLAADDLSPVTRQHIDLFQGGQLSEAAVEAAKARIQPLLERGDLAAIEAGLRPGTQYVIQVRALAEIGTDDAGRILERQLQRRLTDDAMEQAWYWIDLANGLRSLNREQSLPHLLRCAEAAAELPLGHFFAAETVCFLAFAGHLREPASPLGVAAVRILHRALEGLRRGVPPQLVSEARLGEAVEIMWDNRPGTVHPLVVRVLSETQRLLRRAPHLEAAVAEEHAEQDGLRLQLSRMAALEDLIEEYLHDAPESLLQAIPKASVADQRDLLGALLDLRSDTARTVLPLLEKPDFPHAELAIEGLTWSKDRRVGPWLRSWAARAVPLQRRITRRRRAWPQRRTATLRVPYRTILRALRGHPSPETERFLILAACDFDPSCRAAALSSLGWWEPFHPPRVFGTLQEGRRDPNPQVRQTARAALARLGERQSLQWFRQSLTSEDTPRVHEAIQSIAAEGLTLLWPDLDRLADAENADVAFHARETLECLGEELGRQSRL